MTKTLTIYLSECTRETHALALVDISELCGLAGEFISLWLAAYFSLQITVQLIL